ncbi:hypothetical protein HanIR_Chr15g0767001 [Helianthus annuus]|nr:hypothetical protein HanIR_Chr15g0767001 [Helianthus annuus]
MCIAICFRLCCKKLLKVDSGLVFYFFQSGVNCLIRFINWWNLYMMRCFKIWSIFNN